MEVKDLVVTTTVPGFLTSAEIISGLRKKYHGMVYDVSTPKGMAQAIEARKELRDARIALDKKKPEVKREALDFCKKVEDDYKAIRSAVSEYEDVPDAAIKKEEARREAEKQAKIEAERKRVSDIMASIEAIKSLPTNSNGMASSQIIAQIDCLDQEEITDGVYQEFIEQAAQAKKTALLILRVMYEDKLAEEQAAAKAKAEEEAKAAQEEAARQERDRLAKIEAERLAAEAEKLRIEKAEFARQQAEAEEARAKQAEKDRAAREEAERIIREANEAAERKARADREAKEAEEKAIMDADNKRIAEEQAARQAELDRQQAEIKAQREAAEKAERDRLAALSEAKKNHKKCNCPWCQSEE